MSARFFLALRGVPYNRRATHKETFLNSSQEQKERVVLRGSRGSEASNTRPRALTQPLSEPVSSSAQRGQMFLLKGCCEVSRRDKTR